MIAAAKGAAGDGRGPGAGRGQPLLALRTDLRLSEGAPDVNGAPTWLIEDPLRHQFLQIDGATFDALAIWTSCATDTELKARLDAEFARRVTTSDVEALTHFLVANDLVVEPPDGGWRTLSRKDDLRTRPLFERLIHNYLFFRIPLVRPDAFLRATAGLVAPLMSRAFLWVTLGVAVVGLYLALRQWDAFLATAAGSLTWQGAAAFGIALIAVKAVHEFAHAYVAVRFGCRVPVMGVAFMLLFPLLYSDVTDAWRLKSRRARLAIDSAGVAAELAVASFATLLWAFLPDGAMKSAVFMLATAAWVMSLAINLNPFMRFDGYYVLSDVLGVDNLQSRAFALAKWALREALFGLGRPPPDQLSPRRRIGLILYAYSVWIYRLILFIGIAILVYVATFKVLGILLFVVEIVFLILRPIFKEVREWVRMRKDIISGRRWIASSAVAALSLALLSLPISGTVIAPAILARSDRVPIYAPRSAELIGVDVDEGDAVVANAVVARLRDQGLDHELRTAARRLAAIRLRLGRIGADAEDRDAALVLERDQQALETRIGRLKTERDALTLRAPAGGEVLALASNLKPGRWIANDIELALIGESGKLEASGYVEADDLARVSRGASGVFIPDDPLGPRIPVVLEDLALTGSEAIDLEALSEPQGGSIAVARDDDGKLVPIVGQYRARWRVSEGDLGRAREMRGVIHLSGRAESVLARFWRQILKVIAREAGA